MEKMRRISCRNGPPSLPRLKIQASESRCRTNVGECPIVLLTARKSDVSEAHWSTARFGSIRISNICMQHKGFLLSGVVPYGA